MCVRAHVGECELSDEREDSQDEEERQVDAQVERDVDERAQPEDEADTEVGEFGRRQQRIHCTRPVNGARRRPRSEQLFRGHP